MFLPSDGVGLLLPCSRSSSTTSFEVVPQAQLLFFFEVDRRSCSKCTAEGAETVQAAVSLATVARIQRFQANELCYYGLVSY